MSNQCVMYVGNNFSKKLPFPLSFFFPFWMHEVCITCMFQIGKACGEKWKTMTYEVCALIKLSMNFFVVLYKVLLIRSTVIIQDAININFWSICWFSITLVEFCQFGCIE